MIHKRSIYEKYIKRAIDVALSFLAIIVLSPVMVIVAILVRIKLGTPVIFKQERPGLHGNIFTLYKFRTMTDAKDQNGRLFPDEDRMTDFGRRLRSASLDELPELFNILKGDMAFVGPRPLLVKYLSRYSQRQKRRHEVMPGLTGYAQINGRNSLSWEERFEMDIWYVDHINFILDVKILFKTVSIVLKKDGINSETSATMEEFKGER